MGGSRIEALPLWHDTELVDPTLLSPDLAIQAESGGSDDPPGSFEAFQDLPRPGNTKPVKGKVIEKEKQPTER